MKRIVFLPILKSSILEINYSCCGNSKVSADMLGRMTYSLNKVVEMVNSKDIVLRRKVSNIFLPFMATNDLK